MKLLQKNPARLELSNDAFYCLYFGEDLIDDANIDEVNAVLAMFPNGFDIKDDWELLDNTGLVKATFIAKNKRPDWPEGYLELINGWLLLFKLLPDNIALVQRWHESRRPTETLKTEVKYYGKNPWVKFENSSYPLLGRTKKWVP